MKFVAGHHDFEEQKRETYDTFDVLRAQGADLPRKSVIEFYFLAEGSDSNWLGFERELHANGFLTERADDGETLIVISRGELNVSPDEIWAHEKAMTEIALSCDFVPDGWEFGFD